MNNNCEQFIKKYTKTRNMIALNDKNVKMHMFNHTISLMFQIEKNKYSKKLEELNKSKLFDICISSI
jgi:hypothetical protein